MAASHRAFFDVDAHHTETALVEFTFPPAEERRVDAWLRGHKLNMYGGPVGTMYTGGSPCFDEHTGMRTCTPHSALLAQYPHRPWNSGDEHMGEHVAVR